MTFPVDWTDLIGDDQEARSRSLYSRNGDVYLVIHHAYNRTVYQTIETFKSPNRTVSAQFAFGPKTAGVDECFAVRTVVEDRRAYTTSSWIDDQAITVECSNLSLDAPYPVGQSVKRRLAELAAYMHTEYGMPLDRWHVTSHREVYARGWGSYATACPGDDLQAALDWIVAEAIRIVAGGNKPEPEEDIMERFAYRDDRDRKLPKGKWVTVYLNDKNDASFAVGKSLGMVNAYLQLEGLPVGEGLKVRLLKTKAGTSEERGGIAAREIPGTTGTTFATVTMDFQLDRPDDGIRVQIAADTAGVTLLRADVSGLRQKVN